MVTDPIADMLTRIRNAQHARKSLVRITHSKQKLAILKVLEKNEFIKHVKESKGEKFPEIEVELHPGSTFAFRRISKPGRRIHSKSKELEPVLSDLGIAVVSTSSGFLTNKEAQEKGVGGEVICEVY